MLKKIVPIWLFLFSLGALQAEPSEVELIAEVTGVEAVGETVELMVALVEGVSFKVIVTEQTQIRDEDDNPLTAEELEVGMTLKVEGTFTGEAILADEVTVSEDENSVEVKGPIQSLDAEARTITVQGLTFSVPPETEIKDDEGNPLDFSELEPGQFVKVEGNVVEDQLVASEVKLKIEGAEEGEETRRPTQISIHGIVESVGDLEIIVLIEGLGPVPVRIVPGTDIKGDLEPGVLVRVIGTFEDDLGILARKILVKRLLQLAPGRLHMRLEQTRRVEVILRETLGQDVPLEISVLEGADLLTVSVPSITIPSGTVTGFFEVTSGSTEGEAQIQVQMPAEMGGLAVLLPVKIRAEGEGEDRPQINWSPGTLNVATEVTTVVRLRVSRPAPAGLVATLTLSEGPEGLVSFPELVEFEEGSKVALVEITTGAEVGEAEIEAALPDEHGGDSKDLKVKVREDRRHRGGEGNSNGNGNGHGNGNGPDQDGHDDDDDDDDESDGGV